MKRREFCKGVALAPVAGAFFPLGRLAEAATALAKEPEAKVNLKTLNGNMGTDPMWSLTTHTGANKKLAKASDPKPKMKLTKEEQEILDGKQGPLLQKAMKTIVAYGELFGADRLVDLDHAPHIALSWGTDAMLPLIELYEQFAAEGLKTYAPFTADPLPYDLKALDPGPEKKKVVLKTYRQQERLTKLWEKLGMVKGAWSCACYVPEVGNIPKKGDNLAWSESSAINYVNSAIGARTNRTTFGIDMLTALLGKAPVFGLMTEEGRKAKWLIEVKGIDRLPHPEMVGSAVGLKCLEDVPYIVGMDKLINALSEDQKLGYLKDLGAATASNGAVGLYHMEGVTPEAKEKGRDLLADGYRTYVIDWKELKRVYDNYPMKWPKDKKDVKPDRVFIGCPLNSRAQLEYYGKRIIDELKKAKKSKVAVPTYMHAHEAVTAAFRKANPELAKQLDAAGVKYHRGCPMLYLTTPELNKELIVTSSNKTRVYTTARYFPDLELLQVIVTGKIPETVTGGVNLDQFPETSGRL